MTHEDARTIMRRIANDYDRLAKVAEGNSPIRKEERLNQNLEPIAHSVRALPYQNESLVRLRLKGPWL